MEQDKRVIKIGDIVRHFKGNEYIVIGIAEHTENGEKLVVYRGLFGDFRCWCRPYEAFMSEVDHDKYPDVTQKYRFEII